MNGRITALIFLTASILVACASSDGGDQIPTSDIWLPSPVTGQIEITPSVTAVETVSDIRTDPQVDIKTDRELYKQGESILVSIENNSSSPIQFIKFCALHLCINYGGEWICEEHECDSQMMFLDPGSKLEFLEEARSLVPSDTPETNYRYKLEYQIISEDPYYFGYSNEFLIEK